MAAITKASASQLIAEFACASKRNEPDVALSREVVKQLAINHVRAQIEERERPGKEKVEIFGFPHADSELERQLSVCTKLQHLIIRDGYGKPCPNLITLCGLSSLSNLRELTLTLTYLQNDAGPTEHLPPKERDNLVAPKQKPSFDLAKLNLVKLERLVFWAGPELRYLDATRCTNLTYLHVLKGNSFPEHRRPCYLTIDARGVGCEFRAHLSVHSGEYTFLSTDKAGQPVVIKSRGAWNDQGWMHYDPKKPEGKKE